MKQNTLLLSFLPGFAPILLYIAVDAFLGETAGLVAGAVPAYAPCAPAYAEPAADSGDTGEPGFWSRLFGRDKPAEPAQAEPAGSATTPAP